MNVLFNAWRRAEIWLAIALLAASFVFAGRFAVSMATSSLSTDEFGTVTTFSSRGPGRVVTDYRAPKNHIFFNLLNSVLPARASLNPARVRALSILATLLTLVLIAGYAARRGQGLEGAALVAILTFAIGLLTLSMEARGYGFLGLFGVMGAIAAMEYPRAGRAGWLWVLGGASVLGVYTVPSFLIFAAPLLFLVWAANRDRRTFITGLAAGLAILLLYAPVLRQVVAAFTAYQVSDESEFASITSMWRAVRLYLVPCTDLQAAGQLAVLLLAPFVAMRVRDPRDRLGPCLVAIAAGIYLASLLFLRTAPLRMAACGMVPLAFVGILSLGVLVRRGLPFAAQPLLLGGTALLLLLDSGRQWRDFRFLPTEDWILAGRAIDAGFPPETRVDFARYAKYLKHTLPGAEKRSAAFDPAAFAAGKLIVADAGNKWAEGSRFQPPPVPGVVAWTISGSIRDVVVTFRRPESSGLPGLPPEATDGIASTKWPLPPAGWTVPITPAAVGRSVVLLFDRPLTAEDLEWNLPAAFLAGNALVLPLGGSGGGGSAELTLRAKRGSVSLTEAWISR